LRRLTDLRPLLALVVLGAVAATGPACGASGGADSSGATSYTPIVPPSRPDVPHTAGGTTRWYALKASHLGVTNRTTGQLDPDGWRAYGFDLDGRDTTADDSIANRGTCTRRPGALTRFLQDGDGGIDDNFGQHVMPAVRSFKSDVESFLDDAIAAGKFTLLLRLDGVSAANDPHVPGALYLASAFAGGASRPTFTEADHWPIDPTSLADGASIDAPKVTFPDGYVAGGVWVSGSLGAGTLDLGLLVGGTDGPLPIESPVIAVPLGDLGQSGQGTIAGAIATESLKVGLTPVARRLGICPGGNVYDSVVSTLSLAADLVSGAPHLQDTSVECDAISVGIGFDLAPTGAPSGVGPQPAPPAPDQCTTTADAGPG
jgi:hypothetical protein